jgi:hypothetical protein
MTTPTTADLRAMLNVSECGHPGPWTKNPTGAIVDSQGCEVISAWDGTASINLAAAAPDLAADNIRLREGIEALITSGNSVPVSIVHATRLRALLDGEQS